MSDFFIDENSLEENNQPNEDKKSIKPKKIWVKILCYLLPLLILAGGLFGIVKLIPKKQDKTETDTMDIPKVGVLSLKSSDVKNVTVTNEKGTVSLYFEKEESESNWYVDGVKKEYISTSLTSSLVESAVLITASKKVEDLSDKNCGLDNPSISVELLKNDDTTVCFYIGKDTPIGNECYLKLSNSDTIYLVDKEFKDKFDVDALSFASTNPIPAMTETKDISDYFENGKLAKFDAITVTGKNYPQTLTVVPNDETELSGMLNYKITSPEEHYADKIDELVSLFSDGIPVTGIYSFKVNNLKEFNLNKPDLSLTMKIKSKLLTYSFALQDDGNFAAWCNEGDMIYKVAPVYIEKIVNAKAEDYYYNMVYLAMIDDVKSVVISNGDMVSEFSIKKSKDEDSEDKYVIKLGKKKIDCQNFQNFYQYLISLPCYDFTKDNDLSVNKKIRITYNFNNGVQTDIDFVKFDETKYQYYINGKAQGKVASTKINKMLKYLEKLIKGENIEAINQ